MISIKKNDELECMRQSCRKVAKVRSALADRIAPGVKTRELDALAREMIADLGGTPTFYGYHGFPGRVCVSINDEIVHGIPGDREIETGDIVSIDVGVTYNGFVGDCATTVAVGKIDPQVERLLETTKGALESGVAQAVEGNRLSDISHAVQTRAENDGFSVVREFVGHGIGREMHEDPQIPNFGRPGRGPKLKAGMTLAIEPMVNMGKAAVKILDDGWTVVTRDGFPSAHFENTVLVGKERPEVLTVSENE